MLLPAWLYRFRARVLVLVILTILPVVGLMGWNGLVLHRQVQADAQASVRQSARIAANHLEVLLDGVRQMLGVVSQEIARTGQDWSAGGRVLTPFLEAYPQFINLMIADAQGRVMASGVQLKAPITLADRPYWQAMQAQRTFTISDLVVSRSTGKPTLVCAQPVFDDQQQIGAVLIASLDPRCFSQLGVRLGLDPEALLTVIDTQGTVLYRSQDAAQWIGKPASEPHVQDFLAGPQTARGWTGPGLDGLVRIFALEPVHLPTGSRHLAVAIGVPKSEIFAGIHRHLWQTLGCMALVVGAALVLAWFGTELVVLRPQRALLTAIRGVAQGDLATRTGLGLEPGELGELARHVDDMATALESRENAWARAEQALRLDEQRLEALLHLSRLGSTNEAAIASYTLQAAIALTGSRFGWLARIEQSQGGAAEDGSLLTLIVWQPAGLMTDVATSHRSCSLRELGELGAALAAGRNVIANDSAAVGTTLHGLLPPDTVIRHCAVPLAGEGRIGLVVGVGDKARPYDDADVRLLTLLLDELGRLWGRRHEAEQRRHLEAELDQSRKLESLGRLAGGVAHDFNNLLTSVLGYADLARRRADDAPFVREAATRIEAAASQATALTEQLLGFARKGKRSTVAVDVHRCIEQVLGITEHTLGHSISVTRRLEAEHPIIHGDPDQLSQVLLNLALNARDAMPEGGHIAITTGLTAPDHPGDRLTGAGAGEYLTITVSDSGSGIPPEILPHIFEPFFTTKSRGRGTGLGLATCYGIVRNHGGFITVDSEPGQGARFIVHLPVRRDLAVDAKVNRTPALTRGKGTVLVVDDEECVRNILADLLSALGYEPILAEDGAKAVALLLDAPQKPCAAVVDMIMPGMDGIACAEQLRAIRADLRIVFSSGYTPDDRIQKAIASGAFGFVQKPYRLADVAAALSQVGTESGA